MTERERKQRRLARERRMGKYQKKQKGNLFAFRSYVTVILAGAVLLLSWMQTDTSLAVCEAIRTTIAYEMPLELTGAKEILQAFFTEVEEGGMPILEEKVEQETTTFEETEQEVMYYAPDIYDSP